MNKYYEVRVEKTCKAVVNNSDKYIKGWRVYDNERKIFNTISDVKAFIKDQYGSCKSRPQRIYRDGNNGEATHVGYIHKLGIIPASSYGDCASYEQHWVEVNEIRSKTVLV